MTKTNTFWTLLAALAFLAKLAVPVAAAPNAASPWAEALQSSFRLVDGGPGPDGSTRVAGLEILLKPHYKTYWRMPGDSGLPPSFDWSGSQNLRGIDVRWPAPHRFDDSAGSSIGYKERVMFPLVVTPVDPAKPVVLDLKLDYAVCEQICIPARGEARLALGTMAASTSFTAALDEAGQRVPVRSAPGDGGPVAIRAVSAERSGQAISVTALVPASAGVVEVFAESGTDWVFGVPVPVHVGQKDNLRQITWRMKVEASPPGGQLDGLPVTLTLAADNDAVEVSTRLDAEPKPH